MQWLTQPEGIYSMGRSAGKQEHLINRLLWLVRLACIDLLRQLSKRPLSCFPVQRLILCRCTSMIKGWIIGTTCNHSR